MPWQRITFSGTQVRVEPFMKTESFVYRSYLSHLGKEASIFIVPPLMLRRLSGKESACQHRRHGFYLWVGKSPWRRKWQPILVFLPGDSHGQRNLVGYRPWGCKESDTHAPTRRISTFPRRVSELPTSPPARQLVGQDATAQDGRGEGGT